MLGEKIKFLRVAKDLTVRKLAKNSNLSASYISDIENGKCDNPSIGALQSIATALEVTVTFLLDTA